MNWVASQRAKEWRLEGCSQDVIVSFDPNSGYILCAPYFNIFGKSLHRSDLEIAQQNAVSYLRDTLQMRLEDLRKAAPEMFKDEPTSLEPWL